MSAIFAEQRHIIIVDLGVSRDSVNVGAQIMSARFTSFLFLWRNIIYNTLKNKVLLELAQALQ